MNLRPALLIFALLPSCAFRPASEAVTLSPLVFPWSPRPAPKTQVRLKTDAAYFLFEFDVEDSDLV